MEGILGNDMGWSILFALTVVPGIFQLATLPFCPESPKFLLLDKDDEERAVSALTWLRGRVDVHSEMEDMRAEQEKMKLTPHVSFMEMFTNGALRSPLFIALMMMLAQQLSGINAAIFFIMFVVGFATGPGSIPWFFVNELFQQSARPM